MDGENDNLDKSSKKKSRLAIVAIILAIVASGVAGGSLFKLYQLQQNFWGAQSNARAALAGANRAIDAVNEMKFDYSDDWESGQFSIPLAGYVMLNDDFACIDVDAEKHLSGYRITGRVANLSSASRSTSEFEIFFGGRKDFIQLGTKFEITEAIAPAWSREFEVFVPDIDADDLKQVQIIYRSSYISFKRY